MLFKKIYNFFMRFLASIIFLFLATTNVWGLPKCKGDDYKKWTNCYAVLEVPGIKYSGEWKDGKYNGKGEIITIGLTATGIFKDNLIVKGIKNFNDGSSYEGTFKDGIAHGKGKFTYADGKQFYEGDFVEGEWHGKGSLDLGWLKYTGDFVKGKRTGFGIESFMEGGSGGSGGKYEGEFKDDAYHGKGIMTYEDGALFKGTWEYQAMVGYGEQKYSSGDIYKGNFKDGVPHGKGTYIYAEGDTYVGEFSNGQVTGKGKMNYSNGQTYEGYFLRSLKNGEGTQTWPNGEIYKGGWKGDLYHGKGKYLYPDGASYEGNFIQGELEGKGKIVYKKGDTYEGDIRRWVESGFGTMIYSNAEVDGWKKYIGQWDEGLESGKGKVEYHNGDFYEGEFKDSELSGNGIFQFEDGEKYIGEFKQSEYHGKGKYFYNHAGFYDGEWRRGLFHGKGKLIEADKSIFVGNFENGCEHGYGEKTYKKDLMNRLSYKGNWDNCKISGKGEMKYADGSTYAGLFKDGEKLKGSTKIAQFETDEKYYALVIGNNNYQKKEKLSAAVNDAKVISNILQDKYGFEVTTLIDAKYSEVVDNLISFTKDRKPLDNLLIYYAGHGELSSDENKGYWLPVDAGEEQDSKWISNDIVRNRIKATKAKHVLLVVDSCFAGSISRGGAGVSKSIEKLNNINVINRFKMRKTRLVITSGGNEPVSDSDGGKHSVFANKFIDVLKNNNNVIQSMYLFQNVSDYVINNAQQTPNRTIIHGTGDDGGDFLFFPTG